MRWERYEPDDDAEDIAAGLSAVLGPRGLNAPPGLVEQQLSGLLARLSPADAENILSGFKDVGQNLQRFATSKEVKGFVRTAAPIAGGVVGTYFGGPMGTQFGAQLGGMAGRAVTGGGLPTGAQARQVAQGAVQGAVHGAVHGAVQGAMPALGIVPPQGDPTAGSTAAAQLLSIIQNPALVSSLLSLTMGANGAATVPVGGGGTQVPVGAMMNLVGTLANQAAEDADAILLTSEADSAPEYLLNESGCVSCDPAVASQRADAVMRLLNAVTEAEAEAESDDYDGEYDEVEYLEDWPGSEWLASDEMEDDWY